MNRDQAVQLAIDTAAAALLNVASLHRTVREPEDVLRNAHDAIDVIYDRMSVGQWLDRFEG